MGSNQYESQFESDRRLDSAFPAEFLRYRIQQATSGNGRIFVADTNGQGIIGWVICHLEQHETFVKEGERDFGYIDELYIEEAHRGAYVGRALIRACEEHFRAMGVASVMITALAPNERAVNAYRSAGFKDYSINFRKIL